MSDNSHSPKMLLRDLFLGLVLSVLSGAIVNEYSGNMLYGIMIFFIVLLSLWLLKEKFSRNVKVFHSGNSGYYYSFPLNENPKVWKDVKNSFCYLGISFDSIKEYFMDWIEKNHLPHYRILLMDPDSDSLSQQEAFKRGDGFEVRMNDLSPESKQDIEAKVAATKQRIQSAIAVLKNTVPYKEGRLEIRLYDEFTPWWVYMLDDKIAYIGILEKAKSGSNSPVLIMKKRENYTGTFDAFKNNLERIWHNAKKA